MLTDVYKHYDIPNRKAYFRGVCYVYDGPKKIVYTCKEVRTNRKEAEKDSLKLAKKLQVK